jgi:C4-dicarboxylate-specific signal transduction histidine kinase
MEEASTHALDEIKQLQGCINDLISVQTLPAIWSGLDARQIVNTLLDVLIRVLRLDFAVARVDDSNSGPPIEAVRLPPDRQPDSHSRQLRALEAWLKSDLPATSVVTPNPIGTGDVKIALCRLGLQDEIGLVVAASMRTDFPTELEMILLRVAANQAVVGLQEARLFKRAEERLRRSEARLAEGQKLSHTGSWGWNVSAGELIFSLETYHILGFDPDQPAPTFQAAMDRFHPEDRPFVARILEVAIRDRKAYEFEVRVALPDKSIRHVRCAGRPLTNQTGHLEYVGTVLDVTDRKRAEESLQIAQAQLTQVARVTTMGELTAAIAHEVNQPLAAVIADGNAGLRWLAATEPNLDEARAALARIVKQANRASQVVTGIRAFVKKSQPNTSSVAMNQLIDEVLALTRYEVRREGASLRTELATDLHDTRGDPVQLQQVVLNLIMNAVEAMSVKIEGPRELFVSSQNQGSDQIVVSVRDSGVGIAPGSVDELFKPFVTSKAKGMGLGLSISRSIVEAHGGRLWAAPNMDHGATFQFSLPASGR